MTSYTEVVISVFDKAPFPFPIRLEENLSQSDGFRRMV